MREDYMRKPYLLLFSLLSLISCPVAFADNAPRWHPEYAADTVEESGWIIFGVIVLVIIAIGRGIYYSRKNAKKVRKPRH